MAASRDERLAAIAAKSVKEVPLSPALQRRLAGAPRRRNGGKSSPRVQTALDLLWPYTVELFAADDVDCFDGRTERHRARRSYPRFTPRVEPAHRWDPRRGRP